MTVKTAISLDAALFQEAEALARDMNMSRSQFMALALREFLRHQRNRGTLDRLNRVYGESEGKTDSREDEEHAQRRRSHRRLVEGSW